MAVDASGQETPSGNTAQRWRAGLAMVTAAARRTARQYPVSLSFVLATWLLALGTGSVQHGPPTAVRRLVVFPVAEPWHHPLSVLASLFWSTGPRGYVLGTIALLGLGIGAERRLGSSRYTAALALTHAGALLTTGVAAAALSPLWSSVGGYVAGLTFSGPWASVAGATFAASASMPALWRRRVRVGGTALLTTFLLYSGGGAALMAVPAAVIGWALGRRWHRGDAAGTSVGAVGGAVGSLQEARTLGALIVAATAAGPLLAALNPTADGPLAVTAYLMAPTRGARADVVAQLCAEAPSSPACTLGGLHLHQGLGTSLLAALPAVLLLLAAVGMRRGRRLAWVAAIVLQCVLVAEITAAYLLTLNDGATIPASTAVNDEQPSTVLTGLLLPVLVPLTVSLVALVLGRDLYTVTEPARSVRRLATRLGTLFAAAAMSYVTVALLVPSQWTPTPSAATLLLDVPRRLLPLEMVLGVVPNHDPTGPIARLLVEWWGVAFWAAAIGVLVHDSRRATLVKDEGRTAAQAVLRAHGGGPIAWMGMWAGNSYWFDAEGTSYVPYRVVHKVALTTGDLVGPPRDRPEALSSFTAFCQASGWVPCFYSVTADLRSLAAAQGWHSLQIAEEPYLELGRIAFTGKTFQDLRSAFNTARRAGIQVRWIDYRTADTATVRQVHAISEDWVARQALPEMGFTLGGLDQLADPDVRCSIVVDPTGRVHAVASWLPIHTDGSVTGWTLDFMRRRQDGFGRSIDLLIAQAILDLQAEGFATLSLSGAPLAQNTATASRATGPSGSPGSPGSPQQASPVEVKGLDRLLTLLGARLEPVYGFRSLLRFKAKFAPKYRPVYLLYPDAAALPVIARAVTSAYVPDATLRTTFRLLRRITMPRKARDDPHRRGAGDPAPAART